MKQRVLLVTGLFCLVFLAAGAYIAFTISAGTAEVDGLIQMHQVELLREKLLFAVKTVKSGVKARNTRFFRGADEVIQDVLAMERSVEGCFACHHSPSAKAIIDDLLARAVKFEAGVSRVLTVRANEERLAREEDVAYALGSELEDKINEMIGTTSSHLQRRTRGVIARIETTNRILYLLLALGPLLAIGLAWMYLRSFARPVGVLLDATRALKAGHLEHRVAGLTHEFREVGESFNDMADALQEQLQHLQRAEQMVVCGKVAAGLAHEIKNPLAGVQVSLQVLAEELALSEEDRGIFESAKEEIVRIDSLVKGLLDFARPGKPELGPVNVNEVVDRAVALTTQRIPSAAGNGRKVRVSRDLEPDLPRIVADPKHLLQVFLNLMLNAVEAMPDGGALRVTTRSVPEAVEVDVWDTGPGVDAQVLDRIFEPFFTRKPKGTGLGLSISRSLVEQLGGTIRVANRPEGGACFTVVVPRRDPAGERAA